MNAPTTTNPQLDPVSRTLGDVRAVADGLLRPAVDQSELETVDAVLQAVRTWGSRELDSAKTDAEAKIPKALYEQAAELGLFGLTIPQEYGGAGLSILAAGRITEEMALYDRSVATAIGLHNGLGLRGLIRFGSPQLKERYLPDLATGKRIAAFCATEPNAGSHIAGVKTVGAWDGGQRLTVNGEKIAVTNGGVAAVYTLLASTPGLGGARKGFSLLLVDRGLPGVAVGREEHKLGMKGSSTTSLTFDNVAMGVEQVIGEGGKGLDHIAEVLAWGRTLMSAGCVGTAREAWRRTAEYVQTRHQFGKPIGAFDQVREKIAQMRARLYAAECLVRLTTLLPTHHGSDIIWESSIAKVFCSEMVFSVTDDAIQLHGGSGYIEETGICRLARDCRVTRIFEGANELLRFHISAQGLGYHATLAQAPALAGQIDAALAEPARRFDELRARLAEALATIRKRWGLRTAEHQLALARAADAAIAVFTTLAVLLRTDGELRVAGAGEAEKAHLLRLSRYACQMLERSAEEALAAAGREADEELVRGLSEYEYARTGPTA
ncbi:MAG: acyl-CoA dehydrogenase family protein [Deltaproteobacteria bacterium]|nr:acyl-CoA dehydrogenase family protein [Deltaproteobacteria bacterium]